MIWPYLPLASVTDFVDPRVLKQMASDTGDDLTDGQLATQLATPGSVIDVSRTVGAGRIDQALQSAGKYDWNNLWVFAHKPDGTVTGDYLSDGVTLRPDQGIVVRKLNAGLLLADLQQRRLRIQPDWDATLPIAQWAAEQLERISQGWDVLGITNNVLAGFSSRVRCRPAAGDPWINKRMFPLSDGFTGLNPGY